MAEQDQAADVGGEGASELEEIAGLLEGDDDSGDDGGADDAADDAGGDDGKPTPKPKGKPAEEKPKGERVSWKEFRDKRKGLDARESEIERKAREVEERERGLGEKAERVALLDRLASGDGAERLEALAALGVDLDEVIAAQIDAQRSGKPKPKPKDKPTEETPEAKRLRELEERLAAREEAEVQRRAEEVFDGEASKDPILSKLSRERRLELGHALASEYHAAGKAVPHPSKIPGLLAARLKAEYEEMRAIFEEAPQEEKPRTSGARTLGRPDSKVRGGPRATIRTDDEELAEITALLR